MLAAHESYLCIRLILMPVLADIADISNNARKHWINQYFVFLRGDDMKSPNWLEEEVMLALDLYVHRDLDWINKMKDSTFEIKALSKLLNGLNLHSEKPTNFRSTGSIRMKLANFMALDEHYKHKSLGNIGGVDKLIWEKYKNDYVALHEKCKQIISKYLVVRDDVLNKYIENMQLDGDGVNIDKDFAQFANSLKISLGYYEKIAAEHTDNVYSKKVIESCKEMRELLAWVRENDEIIFEYEYKEHAGVNLKPINNKIRTSTMDNQTEEKIGKLIHRTFVELIEQDKLSDDMVSKLLHHKYCRDQFGIRLTFLREIDDQRDIRMQIMDENGYVRYWTKPVLIHGKKYCVCKEWFENQRERYLRWLSIVNVSPFYMLKAKQLKDILEYLKEKDLKNTCITKQEIMDTFPIETIQEVINILIDRGVLVHFQGSAREFVIDDYDVLYRMMRKPEDYSGD